MKTANDFGKCPSCDVAPAHVRVLVARGGRGARNRWLEGTAIACASVLTVFALGVTSASVIALGALVTWTWL